MVTISPSGFAIPAGDTAAVIIALRLSGSSQNGATFQARFLPSLTASIGQRSGLRDRIEQPAQPVLSALIATTLLALDEVLSLSENPVRSASLILNFAETPGTAAIYTLSGRLVVDLRTRATGDERIEWDLRNSEGTPVAPGVYLVLFDIGGTRYQQKLIILRNSGPAGPENGGAPASGSGAGDHEPAAPPAGEPRASPYGR
jgi:hypothetical protein